MITNFKPSQRIEETTWRRVFDYDYVGTGFAFPCNEEGEILMDQMPEPAIKNYKFCMAHPEKFVRFDKLESQTHHYTAPAEGDCSCGEHIQLFDQYMGACECPNCRQWYNVFGEELLPPEQWEEDY